MRKVSRRRVLAGLGASVALPPLLLPGPDAAAGKAGGGARRFVLFQWNNGCDLRDWAPSTVGPGFAPSPILEGLGDRIDAVNVVSGLSNAGAVEAAADLVPDRHERCFASFLTGMPATPTGSGGISIDQRVAQTVGADAVHPALVVGVTARDHIHNGRYSWLSPSSPVAPVTDPGQLFNQLFGDASLDAQEREQLAALRVSILDRVKADIDAVRPRLAVADRVRLDEHLVAVEQLEKSVAAIECSIPDEPGALSDTDEDRELRGHVLIDLVVEALRCDLTRVVAFSLGSTGSSNTFPFLGIQQGDHEISHLDLNTAANRDTYTAMTRWKVAQFKYMLDRLADAELLQDTIVVAMSEMSRGGSHSADMLPVLVAGGAMATGRHIVVPCDAGYRLYQSPQETATWCSGSSNETPLSNLWLTVMRALGIDDASFGDSTSTLEGLWT
jgi:hypothetical protein